MGSLGLDGLSPRGLPSTLVGWSLMDAPWPFWAGFSAVLDPSCKGTPLEHVLLNAHELSCAGIRWACLDIHGFGSIPRLYALLLGSVPSPTVPLLLLGLGPEGNAVGSQLWAHWMPWAERCGFPHDA